MAKEVTSKLRPASNYYTTKQDEAVKLRTSADASSAIESFTIPYVMYRTAKNFPDVPALKRKNADNVWETVTYSQYRENVIKTAKIFIKLGLEPKNTVAILAFNSPEWFYSELAAIHAG